MEDPTEFDSFFSQQEEPDSPTFCNGETSPRPFAASPKHLSCHSSSAKEVQPACFDVRVFYVRASSCMSDEAPDTLLIVYPPRGTDALLEVNRGRISPSERACFVMRRDRADAGAAEATYVSTNILRTSGDLPFEIYDKDDLIIHGKLGRADTTSEHESNEFDATYRTRNKELGWQMECECGIVSHSCFFLKGRMDFSTVNPTMEVYVAGQSSGLPLALTTTIHLSVRRKALRQSSLDAIPEMEESHPNQILSGQVAEDAFYAKIGSFYQPMNEVYLGESEEGELSWFNAGVRVGVGIGLGLCLGVGIGVGLLVRPLKKRLF
ncbi:hypothetical protein KP509_22G015700 [Ceratopteris richardii]|uniref:Uncharacterized protein n=1 Tax=Ceratopteris richardii TaxID=49495 RepID=A0A8T2S4Y4_CERRI|nr:hypothetical protein KP509_22G015700 [Ceratopteris richardii]